MHRACGCAFGVVSGSATHSEIVPHVSAIFRIGRLRYYKRLTGVQQGFSSHANISQRNHRVLACKSSLVDMDSDISDLIQKIHDHPAQAVLYATGGGIQVRPMQQKLSFWPCMATLTAQAPAI